MALPLLFRSSMGVSSLTDQLSYWRREQLTGFVDSPTTQFMIMMHWYFVGRSAFSHQHIWRHLICKSEHSRYSPSNWLRLTIVPQFWSSRNQSYRCAVCRFRNEYFPGKRHHGWMWVILCSLCVNTWTVFFDLNSKLTAIFICPTYFMLRAFRDHAFKVDSFFLSSFLNPILSRVNLLYHLVYMAKTLIIIFLSRSYFLLTSPLFK